MVCCKGKLILPTIDQGELDYKSFFPTLSLKESWLVAMTRLDIRVEIGQLVLSEKDFIGILCTEILQIMLVNVPGVLEEKVRHKELLCSLSLLHNQWK